MIARRFAIILAVWSFVATASVSVASAAPAPPCGAPALKDLVQNAVDDMLIEKKVDQLDANWNSVTAAAVAGALDLNQQFVAATRSFDEAQAETRRSDKQVSAPSGSTGTTTLVEKVGLPRLLGLAIDYNAIQQENNGTSLTLRSTPYALIIFLLGWKDDADSYQKAGLLPQIDLSGNFALDESENAAPGGIDFDRFSSFSAKYQFWGDRSPRSEAFQNEWERRVQPEIEKEIAALTGVLADLFNAPTGVDALADAARAQIVANPNFSDAKLQSAATTLAAGDTSARDAMVVDILTTIEQQICTPMAAQQDALFPPEARAKLGKGLAELAAARSARSLARTRFLSLVDEWNEQPGSALQYSLYRVDGGSDYSEFTVLYQQGFSGLDLTLNGAFSINNDPDEKLKEDTFRDATLAIGLERGVDNVVTGPLQPASLALLDIGLSGEVKYLDMADDVLGTVQLKFTLPVYWGSQLPLSLSWASRSEESDDDIFRVSIGGELDVDDLMALNRLSQGLFGGQTSAE